ncbi:sulfite exporter TauE/SafE family protein [Alteromonas sp. 07-89-2]|uniref:sulfite exporter TauE/SafE family protein n=1 Tax=Alteromonas sp. 07-89-2 TaxID=2607609 RepID=UPI00148D73E9|nr:sulfite exporter TauE/SafE family protein [Alteromonas sp. 07-89-2]NOH56648.1 sulfite exporter TauE/SafE family protein [Alteromonas sp. 07-89-2]
MIILGYIAAVLMGMVLGVIGGGGSILTVPILVYLMGVTPDVATGYSLLIVGATAAFGAVRYFKEGLVDVKASILFAVPSIIAVYLTRAFLMPAIPETIAFQSLTIDKNLGIMVLFAMLMLASAAMMLKKAYSKSAPATQVIENKQPNVGLIIIEGAVVGVVTGILGAGGGFLIIPALVLILGMPMKNAVGASLFIIALKSLLGFIGDLQTGIQLEMPLLPLMLVATFIGMAVSTKVAGKLDGAALQKFFAFFTLVIAVFIMTKELL